MRNRRLASALVGGTMLAAVVGGAAAPAIAAPAAPAAPARACQAYPSSNTCTITISVTVTTPGGTISFTVRFFFHAGELITVTIHSQPYVVGHLTAGSDGTVSGTVQVPKDITPGQHELVLTGDHGDSVSTPFTVASTSATASSGSGSLPFTGAEIAAMSTVGGALLVGGAVAFGTGLARKRRNSSTPAA